MEGYATNCKSSFIVGLKLELGTCLCIFTTYIKNVFIDTDIYNTKGWNIQSETHKTQILANIKNNFKDTGMCNTQVKKDLRSLNAPSLLSRSFLAVEDLLWRMFYIWGLKRSVQGIVYAKQSYFDHEMFWFLPWYLYNSDIFQGAMPHKTIHSRLILILAT